MPTTPNGASYTTHTATIPGGGVIHWAVPSEGAEFPLVLYCHGAGGGPDQFSTLGAWGGLRNWLIDNGWAWVEGAGGGAQPWGNPSSQDAYDAAFSYIDGILNISHVVVLGRSMGGIVGARIYLSHSQVDSRWVGFIGNSAVQDLVWAYDWEEGGWTSAFNSAWGVTSKTELVALSDGLNPVGGSPDEWEGKNVLQLWGTNDSLVPAGPNGSAMRTMYRGEPAMDRVSIRQGGDHSTANGSYLDIEAMSRFLIDVTGTPPQGYFEATRIFISSATGLLGFTSLEAVR